MIRGKPNFINNLDERIVRSAKNPGNEKNIHVISMARFKNFVPHE